MKKLIGPSIIWFLLVLGCSGGAFNVSSNCSSSGNTGRCTLKFAKVSGSPYEYKVETTLPSSAAAAAVTAQISSKQKALTAWLEDPDRQKISVKVEPGETATLEGTARLQSSSDKRTFSIFLEPQGSGDDKTAENVEVEVRYRLP
jgi:hypothetical protein